MYIFLLLWNYIEIKTVLVRIKTVFGFCLGTQVISNYGLHFFLSEKSHLFIVFLSRPPFLCRMEFSCCAELSFSIIENIAMQKHAQHICADHN